MSDVLSELFKLSNDDFYKALDKFPTVWKTGEEKKPEEKKWNRYERGSKKSEPSRLRNTDLIMYNIYRNILAEIRQDGVKDAIIDSKVIRKSIRDMLRMLGKPVTRQTVCSWQSRIITRGLLEKRVPNTRMSIITIKDNNVISIPGDIYTNKKAKYVYSISYRGINKIEKYKNANMEKLLDGTR